MNRKTPFNAPAPSAPIALFVYNRPEHAQRTVAALQRNKGAAESDLFVFSDGPKNPDDAEHVRSVRDVIGQTTGFKSINIIERKDNLGLAASIIAGVSQVIDMFGCVIVLEDDLVASAHFLAYMNEALEKYRDHEHVMQISGYMFPVELHADTDAVFLPFTTCWGWGTWKRAWRHFDPLMSAFERLRDNRRLRHKFDLEGSYGYFDMLRAQRTGKIDSWAIRWYLSVFAMGGLILHPVKTLIENRGFDEAGTHCKSGSLAQQVDPDFEVRRFPGLALSDRAGKDIVRYFRGRKALPGRVADALKRLLFRSA